MGGSTNTVLHLLAAAQEAGVGFGLKEIDETSRRVPCIVKVAPNKASADKTYYMEDVHRAGGIPAILGELRPRRAARGVGARGARSVPRRLARRVGRARGEPVRRRDGAVPRGARRGAYHRAVLHREPLGPPGRGRRARLRARGPARLHEGRRSRRALGQHRRGRRDREDRGRRRGDLDLPRPGPRVRVAGAGRRGDHEQPDRRGRRRGHPLRGPQGRPRHAGDAVSDRVPQGQGPGRQVRAGHRRPLLRRHLGPVHRARLPGGRGRRLDRAGRGRGRGRDRHPHPRAGVGRAGRGAGRAPRRAGGAAAATARRTGTGRCRWRSRRTRCWPRPRPPGRCATGRSSRAEGARLRSGPTGLRAVAGPLGRVQLDARRHLADGARTSSCSPRWTR